MLAAVQGMNMLDQAARLERLVLLVATDCVSDGSSSRSIRVSSFVMVDRFKREEYFLEKSRLGRREPSSSGVFLSTAEGRFSKAFLADDDWLWLEEPKVKDAPLDERIDDDDAGETSSSRLFTSSDAMLRTEYVRLPKLVRDRCSALG